MAHPLKSALSIDQYRKLARELRIVSMTIVSGRSQQAFTRCSRVRPFRR